MWKSIINRLFKRGMDQDGVVPSARDVNAAADDNRRVYEEEHARVREEALQLPLPDAVFTIVHYNSHRRCMGPGPHCDPIDLAVLAATNWSGEVELWATRANKLRQEAYAVGDALLRRDSNYEETRAAFESANPGFGQETYGAAISYGCFLAR